MSEPVPEILEALSGAPATLSDLSARLEAHHGLTVDAETPSRLAELLEELELLGLVWRT